MKRKSALIISSLLVAAALWPVVAGSKSPASGEAVYQGRTAQQWLEEVFTTNQSAALNAFRAMGTNALPVLVRAFEKQDSAWDRYYRENYPKLPVGMKKHLSPPPPVDRDRWSAAQLVVLNVPHGHDEIRAMLRLMADPKHPVRFFVTDAAGWLKPGDEDCVPVLLDCLKDTNAVIRWHAAMGLEQIGPGARAALPALTAALDEHITNTGDHKAPFDVRLEIAFAIWRIDRQTDAPARVCREALNSSDAATRGWALVYLCAIHPNDPSLMPKIIERLRGGGVFQLVAASQIGRFGPAAKEAVPDLIKLADSKDWDLRHRARQSLKQIDPEAAARFDQE